MERPGQPEPDGRARRKLRRAIATGDAVASASIGTVNSIDDSADVRFQSAGTNTVATILDDSGGLRVDRDGGAGGTILNIEGALTNSGSLRIGNSALSASDEVTAASLDNSGGGIRLLGSSDSQALLDVTGAAGFGQAGTLRGLVRLAGDSAIEFASGEITGLADKVQLILNGNDAFIEDGAAPGSNSALTGLASVGAGALFALHDGASVSTSGSLVNNGTVRLDSGGGDGGSSLNIGGTLTNSGTFYLGNAKLSAPDEVTAASLDNTGYMQLTGSSTDQALLDVSGAAGFGTTGEVTGRVFLLGDSAIEFASGQITTIASTRRWLCWETTPSSRTARRRARTARCKDSPKSTVASILTTAPRCRPAGSSMSESSPSTPTTIRADRA